MKTMVNSFSEYANTPVIRHEQVKLGPLIEDILDFFKTAYPIATIQSKITNEIPEITADPLRLRQVFNNLIKNALESSPASAEGRIIVSAREVEYSKSPYLEILIEDDGAGIPDELITSIFEPYVTNKNKGSGLGLAIVKKIVEEHHGIVSLKNKIDRGVIVTMRFPITKAKKL
jgi:nitrogen fixation/metabolism regulation signal transduction histidine kinase